MVKREIRFRFNKLCEIITNSDKINELMSNGM